MPVKLPWAGKRMFWRFEKSIFQFFANLWVTKLKPFSGKGGESVKIYLNQNLFIRTFFENGFGGTLRSKTNVLSVWKNHISVFGNFLSDEVETICKESEANLSKLFKSKFGHRKLLRKSFWSYLYLKKERPERLKKRFSIFLQIIERRNWNHFLGKWGKV